jgi:tRNA (adenine-N(1)-)-methyltransferase non-catalytic subunit
MDTNDVIKLGDTVVVRMHDDKSTSMLKVQGDQKICRSKVSTKNLVGAPYGSVFQITSDRNLTLVKDDIEEEEEEELLDISLPEGIDVSSSSSKIIIDEILKGDNRSYIDSNTAQKLTTADIQKLKDSGASGQQIIQSLIANSDTWASKTEFAQEKWLKRKAKKYVKVMRIVKSCPATICEVYHTKNKEKICGLRWDSLAQVLSTGGIHSGSRVLVFDSVLGLIVGSIAYRLRGKGIVLAAYAGQQPHFEIVNTLNLSEDSLSVIQTVPSEELGPASVHIENNGFNTNIPAGNDLNTGDKEPSTVETVTSMCHTSSGVYEILNIIFFYMSIYMNTSIHIYID